MSLILLRNTNSSIRQARHRLWHVAALLPFLLLAACTSPEEKEAQFLARAISLYEQGDDQRAMVELRNVLQINPKNAEAIYQIGLIHERAGRLRQAAVAFRDAANERPDWIAAQFKLGTAALQVATTELQFGLEATVAEAADAIEKAEPGHPDGLALKAALALINGETQQALDHAQAALDKAPQHPEATAMLAGAYTRLGENDRALAAIDEALQNAPENKVLWDAKLAVVEHKGDYGETVRTYEDLLAFQPDNAAYWRALANLHRGQGDLEQAEAVLRQAIENGVLTDETVGALLELVYGQKGFEGAEAELKALIAHAPDNVVCVSSWLPSTPAKSGPRMPRRS